MNRAELDYLNAMHDSLFGARSRPAKQGRTTKEERVVSLHPAHPLREGAFDQGAALAGTGAAPTFGGEK